MAKEEQFPGTAGSDNRTEEQIKTEKRKTSDPEGFFFDFAESDGGGAPEEDDGGSFFDAKEPEEPVADIVVRPYFDSEGPGEEPETKVTGEQTGPESFKRQAAREGTGEGAAPEVPEDEKPAALPDDSLLMGTDSGKSAARPPKKKADIRPAGSEAKEEDGEGPQSREYEERIRHHRERIRYIRTLCAATVLVVIALVAVFFSSRHYNRAEIVKVRDFIAEEASSCENFNGCILQYGPNGAACADTGGRVRWNITYEMDQPIVSISGGVAAIADYGGRTIYVMNTRKQLCTITTGLPIHKISASESGEVAAVLDDKSTTWIRLYSKEGKEIAYFTRSMDENGYPMDVAVSPDGKKVCVSNLKLKDSTVTSSLSFYDFGREGSKLDQHLTGSFEYEREVFPYVRFMGNGVCCAASDSRLVFIDTSGTEPKNSFTNLLTENLQGIFRSGNRIGLVFMDLTRENLYRLDIYGRSGKKEGSIGFSMAYEDIQIKGNRICINNEQLMQIYTLSGREVFNGGFDRAVKVIVPGWLNRLTAVSENEIDRIKLR